jgi:hypothetical protein
VAGRKRGSRKIIYFYQIKFDLKITVRFLEFTIFGTETRGLEFEGLETLHMVTLKIVMSKGREFSVEF